jgi:hypothetical protein
MRVQCPKCKMILEIKTQKFIDTKVFNCNSCEAETNLKNDPGMIVKLEFVLTESEETNIEIIPEENVESFHQEKSLKQPSCSLQQ